jgi:YHS domain-containing protein
MAEHRTVAPNEDPVCGMTVDVAQARAKGLATTYEDREYVFCGKGCLLEFGDEPETYLAVGFTPAM